MQFHYDMIDMKSTIKPYKTNLEKLRIGDMSDGGYVISDLGNTYDALYSYGSDDNIKFERAFWDKYKVESYTYDHTISKITDKPDYVNFFKEGVTAVAQPYLPTDTLTNQIKKNGHGDCNNLFMQMDIEGYEWEVLYSTSDDVLKQFSQMIIEFHMKVPLPDAKKIFERMETMFVPTHIHGNNHEPCPWLDINFPKAFEVTYVRKDLIDTKEVDMGQFPVDGLDAPNWIGMPDLSLDWWKYEYKV